MALKRIITGFSQVFVGVLFIISGLIKLNDPVGFSFKLQDYFAPDVLDLDFLSPYALMIAVVVVLVEVVLGVMLLVGYAKKLTLWSLMAMILDRSLQFTLERGRVLLDDAARFPSVGRPN